MIASKEVVNRQLSSGAATKDSLGTSVDPFCTSSTPAPSPSRLSDSSSSPLLVKSLGKPVASSADDENDGKEQVDESTHQCLVECTPVDVVDKECAEPEQVNNAQGVEGNDTATTSKSHKQKRRIIRSLFDTVQRALKSDHRHVSSSRFTEELAWTEVYGPLYRSLGKDSLDFDIILKALVEKQEMNVRCALLSAVHQAVVADVVDDNHALAISLLKYRETAFKIAKETASEVSGGDDQRREKDSPSGSHDLDLWLKATGALLRRRILKSDDELSLWDACWNLLPHSQASLLMQELAISLENPQILHHICQFLLSTKDSPLIPTALQLLSLQLLKGNDPLVSKAIIYQALRQERHFVECVHAWRQMSEISKAEFEVFVEAVVLRQLRSRINVEDCLEYLAEIIEPPFLYANFDCDTFSSNLWEAIIVELSSVAFEKSKEGDDRALSTEGGPGEAIPSTSMRGTVVTVVSEKQPLTHMNSLAFEILARAISSISDLLKGVDFSTNGFLSHGSDDELLNDVDLAARKHRKIALEKVCRSFNTEKPVKGNFIEVALNEGLIESTTDAKMVAKIMREARDFDKEKLGIYLSQGPDKDYPFQASLRKEYTALVSFSGLSFSDALRRFLSNFRLPGEAQCIDRLMEAFSEELHKQQVGSSVFTNADAVYVLAFSTIMLNTDLHNPTIRSDLRMTKDQFIKNNRGINGGEDLPEEFLSELYENIKGRELHVFRGLNRFMQRTDDNFEVAWSDVLAQSRQPVVSLSLTLTNSSQFLQEMFRLLIVHALPSFIGVFKKSWDDRIVLRAVDTLDKVMLLAARFHLNNFVDEALKTLLPFGHDYANRCTATDPFVGSDVVSVETAKGLSSNDSIQEEDDTLTQDQGENHIPFGLLHSETENKSDDPTGCAEHRGLLALDRSFMFLKKCPTAIEAAWPLIIECLCALRDLKALPSGMSNLDDFADSEGNVLPLSSFAKLSQKRLEDHQRLVSGKGNAKPKGWFRSFFRNKKGAGMELNEDEELKAKQKVELSCQAKALLGIAVAADVEKLVQTATTQHPEIAVKVLLNTLDNYPFEDDPGGEQHAVFALELAARALLSNQTRSAETYLPFLSKFESILCRITETEKEDVPAPFVIERIVVTILRSCIHLYEFDELRPHLRASLQLLIMTLPRPFVRAISDRMACGLAIILRASFQYFQSQEWSFMGDTLDVLANYSLARVFVFDGIASTVEYALTDTDEPQKPELSLEGCGILSRILTRFVLGFYQADMTLTVPSMLCLEKVYHRKVVLLVSSKVQSAALPVPDLDFWQNVAVALYSVCRSSDSDISHEGLECFQRIVLRSAIDQVPGHKWAAIFYLMVNKQPPVTAELSRVNTFSLLGQVMTSTVAKLSHDAELREDLEDFVNQYAGLADENLQQSRRGNLFKGTLQTLTYVSNHLVSSEWSGDKEFGSWASEVLLKELERVGREVKPTTTVNAKEEEDVSEISDSAAESEVDN